MNLHNSRTCRFGSTSFLTTFRSHQFPIVISIFLPSNGFRQHQAFAKLRSVECQCIELTFTSGTSAKMLYLFWTILFTWLLIYLFSCCFQQCKPIYVFPAYTPSQLPPTSLVYTRTRRRIATQNLFVHRKISLSQIHSHCKRMNSIGRKRQTNERKLKLTHKKKKNRKIGCDWILLCVCVCSFARCFFFFISFLAHSSSTCHYYLR